MLPILGLELFEVGFNFNLAFFFLFFVWFETEDVTLGHHKWSLLL